MADDAADRELAELKTLLAQNKAAVEKLRAMIENMELLLASMSVEKTETMQANATDSDGPS